MGVSGYETDYRGSPRDAPARAIDGWAGKTGMTSAAILIVADARSDQLRLERIVSDAGYTVIRTCSGAEILDAPMETGPDLVLLDVSMDHMDGFRVCRELTGQPAMRRVPVIMISDADQNVDRLWAEQQGAAALVTKPYTAEQILEQVRRFD